MVAPNKLSDFDPSKFTIVGFCSDCHHDAPIPRINEDMEIPTLIKQLTCSRCGSSNCSIRIIYTGAGGFAYFTGANLVLSDLSHTKLCGAKLAEAHLSSAILTGADLRGSDLNRACLVETDLTEAQLSGCCVYGTSVWNIKGQPASQDNLNITSFTEAPVIVDDLEVAQFIYWRDFDRTFRQPPNKLQRAVHYLATTSLGVWFIQKHLGMRGRIAA